MGAKLTCRDVSRMAAKSGKAGILSMSAEVLRLSAVAKSPVLGNLSVKPADHL